MSALGLRVSASESGLLDRTTLCHAFPIRGVAALRSTAMSNGVVHGSGTQKVLIVLRLVHRRARLAATHSLSCGRPVLAALYSFARQSLSPAHVRVSQNADALFMHVDCSACEQVILH